LPVSFRRIRIAGFKSFAEPVTVELLPGLTGIVGPNGCGKSNVVEALRWAMGENSARSLRGGEMDDVIFAGTAHRPSRNLAEVVLSLEDTLGRVPPPFHEATELEISRRIERGSGSAYRVNGREARARDVQTLFADMASGARSSAMVSQGRVGSLVNAKPEERRSILEEAAGITGLHARRHEAELKLRAAETNLARAEDLRGQLEGQLDGLRRQARQANRYRTISGTIRTAEAELLSLQRARVEALREAAATALAEARDAVAQATAAATAATTQATEAASALPALREMEGQARTALERHRIGAEQLAADQTRAQAELAAAASRLEQVEADLGHARQMRADAEAALSRLAEDSLRLAAEDEAHPPRMAAAEATAAAEADAVRGAEAEANRATEHAAALAARHHALAEALSQATQRARRLAGQEAEIAAERDSVAARMIDPAQLVAAHAARDQAATDADATRAAHEAAEHARTEAHAQAERARAAAREAAARTRAAAREQAGRLRSTAQEQSARLRANARAESEAVRARAQAALEAARAADAAAGAARARLAAEVQALGEILAVKDNERWPRMVDQIDVPAGLESALGAALGEELDSGADTAAARHWRTLPALDPVPALPDGATPLSRLVQGPPALSRALSQAGLVEDEATGEAAQLLLSPGQTLVSRAGGLWRWDGHVVTAGTPTPAAVRLQQRNRLAGLRSRLANAEAAATAARQALTAAQEAERTARATAEAAERDARAQAEAAERDAAQAAAAAERDAGAEADAAERAARAGADAADAAATAAEQQTRAAARAAAQRLEAARAEATRLETQSAAAAARHAALQEQAGRLHAESRDAALARDAAEAALAALADPEAARAAMTASRTALTEARAREAAAIGAREALAREASARAQRRAAIAAESEDWAQRRHDAESRVADLTARGAEARDAHAALAAAPAAFAARHAQALEALEAAEARHRDAADALAVADSAATAADRAARAAEHALSTAREAQVRLEGENEQAAQACAAMAERILERLGENPALPDPPAAITPEVEDKARRKLERLQREREEMGPVNLRAEIEADEVAKHIDTIVREREELTTAIAKLRGSIGHLNREGRERLVAIFAAVDRNFQTLFTRMFGGGRAHLSLVGSDDPLQAGLEIFAQPPGKKLAALSLLSGGEQALTALSLIFAVFQCNPAPVCVLDEVDAPLDDANVDRFCTLLEDMVRETGTRFMVVTHHHLTMARMDRLYGVTMQERGVSRLLSVDLQLASQMVDPTRMAAD
jgi:chromosome segregation protein